MVLSRLFKGRRPFPDDATSKELGRIGEDEAVRFLEKKGCKVLDRNYRTRFGEVDIIVKDKGVIAFVEVKTRRGSGFSLPKEAVGHAKIQRIIKASLDYLSKTDNDMSVRFDVIGIEVSKDGSFEVEYIIDAIEVDG